MQVSLQEHPHTLVPLLAGAATSPGQIASPPELCFPSPSSFSSFLFFAINGPYSVPLNGIMFTLP